MESETRIFLIRPRNETWNRLLSYYVDGSGFIRQLSRRSQYCNRAIWDYRVGFCRRRRRLSVPGKRNDIIGFRENIADSRWRDACPTNRNRKTRPQSVLQSRTWGGVTPRTEKFQSVLWRRECCQYWITVNRAPYTRRTVTEPCSWWSVLPNGSKTESTTDPGIRERSQGLICSRSCLRETNGKRRRRVKAIRHYENELVTN